MVPMRRVVARHCTLGVLPRGLGVMARPQDTLPRVLVVEDEESIREVIAMLLSDEGYEALVAPN